MVLENFLIDVDVLWDRAGKELYEKPEARAGRKMRVRVTNKGLVEDLTGYTLNLGWKSTIDETKFGLDAFTAVDITKGIFELAYTSGMLTNIGTLVGTLQLVPTVGDATESNNFMITVKKSAVDAAAVQSETSFTALASALVSVNDWNARIDAVEADFIQRANDMEATYPQELVSISQQLEQAETTLQGIDRTFGDTTFATLIDLQTTYPTGDTKRYIVAADGKWYWWNGTAWVAGQVAQALGIADGSVTMKKTDFINLSPNLFDKKEVVINYQLSTVQGAKMTDLVVYSGRNTSPIIEVENGKTYTFGPIASTSGSPFYTSSSASLYNESGDKIASLVPVKDGTDPNVWRVTINTVGAKHVRFSYSSNLSLTNINPDTLMWVEGDSLPEDYISFGGYLTSDVQIDILQGIKDGDLSVKKSEKYATADLLAPNYTDFIAGGFGELFNYGMIANTTLVERKITTLAKPPWRVRQSNGRTLYDFSSISADTVITQNVQLYDEMNNLVAYEYVYMNIWTPPANPTATKNILFVGDSLTADGRMVNEFKRRLTTNEDSKCYNLNNFNLVGNITQGSAQFEAVGGRSWENYTKDPATNTALTRKENPFWDVAKGDISLATYMGSTPLDYVVVCLGHNHNGTTQGTRDLIAIETMVDKFVTTIHSEYPDCKIILVGVQKLHPDVFNDVYNFESVNRQAFIYSLTRLYYKVSQKYSYVRFVNMQSRFDSLNNMPMADEVKNVYSTDYVKYVTDFTHPATAGYMQFVDAILPAFFAVNK